MTDTEKLQAITEHFAGGNRRTLADMLNVPQATINTWMHRNTITANGRERIISTFPELSRRWLMQGEGPMIIPAPSTGSSSDLIPLYGDLEGTCGVVEQFERPELATDHLLLPGIKAAGAMPASGDSMMPTINDSDTVVFGHAVSLASVKNNNIYLIITREGNCMFKRLLIADQKVLAVSDNPDYAPRVIVVPAADILHLYPVQCVIKHIA